MEDYNSITQTKWNFDEDRCKELNYYLVLCNNSLINWDLEETYSYLQAIDNITHGVLDDTEQKKIAEGFEKVEEVRRKLSKRINPQKTMIELKNEERNLLKLFTTYQVKHELYFRKKESGFEGL